jgi:hypothetical protein
MKFKDLLEKTLVEKIEGYVHFPAYVSDIGSNESDADSFIVISADLSNNFVEQDKIRNGILSNKTLGFLSKDMKEVFNDINKEIKKLNLNWGVKNISRAVDYNNGDIVIGPKNSNLMFNDEDLNTLKTALPNILKEIKIPLAVKESHFKGQADKSSAAISGVGFMLSEGKLERDIYGTQISDYVYVKKDSDGDFRLTDTLNNNSILIDANTAKKLIKELK